MPRDSYTEGYLKGYEEGLVDAWNDVVKLTTKGLTGREIAMRTKASMATVYQRIEGKKLELGKTEPHPVAAQPQAREVKEQSVFATPAEGMCYIVKEPKPDKSLKIFAQVAVRTQKGMCIVRTDPGTIKNSVRGSNIQFLWLTKSEENKCHENCIQPDLGRIQLAMREFMENGKSGIILLDGLNYLITQNEFTRVLRFIQSIRDDVSARKFSLIIPIDPATMEPREYRQLEAELQTI